MEQPAEQPDQQEVVNVEKTSVENDSSPQVSDNYEMITHPKETTLEDNGSSFGKFFNMFSNLNEEYTNEELKKMKKDELIDNIVPTTNQAILRTVSPDKTKDDEQIKINLSKIAPKELQNMSAKLTDTDQPKIATPILQNEQNEQNNHNKLRRRQRFIRSKRRHVIRRRPMRRSNIASIEHREPNLDREPDTTNTTNTTNTIESPNIVQVASIKSNPTFFDDAATTVDD